MKVAILSTVAWSTPPAHYGSYEWVAANLAEGLVKKGIEVTLFATGNSITSGHLEWIAPHGYEEDKAMNPKVWESMHIANVFEKSQQFDIIHNLIDVVPITYSRLVKTPLVTTFHGIPTNDNLELFKRYNDQNYYVAVSKSAEKPKDLHYCDVVYHGIDLTQYPFQHIKDNFLFCMARIHPDKGIHHAIKIAKMSGKKLFIAGIIQDRDYFDRKIKPQIDNQNIFYLGPIGGKQKMNLLSSAVAFLHPIEFDEPFGLSVIEAQACGTPVIAFNRGSMAEVIRDKKTGYLVNDTNEAVDTIRTINTIDAFKCRKFVEENFSQERMASSYIKLYKRILSKTT